MIPRMAITWLSLGELEFGTNEMPLPMREGYGMAGYSLGGKHGKIGAQTLYARSLALRSASFTTPDAPISQPTWVVPYHPARTGISANGMV